MTRVAKITKEIIKVAKYLPKHKPYTQASMIIHLSGIISENQSYLEKKSRGMYCTKPDNSLISRDIRLQLEKKTF